MTSGPPERSATARLDASLINQTVPPGSLRYYALLYAPVDKRDALVALHLLDDELTATGRSVHHEVAHSRLKWWQEELDRLVRGRPAHPATRALMAVQVACGPELARLQGLVETAAIDLARVTFADEGELAGYFERSGGSLAELAARWLYAPVVPSTATLETVARLGSLCRRVEALRDLRLNAHAGRIQLSLTALDAAGIDALDLGNIPWPPPLQAVLQSTRIALQAQLSQTVASIRGPDRTALRPLLVQAHLYVRLLDRIGEQIPASKPVHPQLRALEKLMVSWRAARSAR